MHRRCLLRLVERCRLSATLEGDVAAPGIGTSRALGNDRLPSVVGGCWTTGVVEGWSGPRMGGGRGASCPEPGLMTASEQLALERAVEEGDVAEAARLLEGKPIGGVARSS